MISERKLNSGHKIPSVGFGTWKIKPDFVAIKAVKDALEAGYRHFDTAQVYMNEEPIGQTLLQSGISREELFVTTKIASGSWMNNLSANKLIPSLDKSLKNLQTDYVDLLLIHFPATKFRKQAWPEMEKAHQAGKAKSIGVSNYTIRHLEELLSDCKVKPAVNQVELHVFLQQPELLEFCNKHEILVEAYSPLAHGEKMSHPALEQIADKYKKTIPQIMIRWCVEVGTVPLPKSTNPGRMKQNFNIFDFNLDSDDMAQLLKLDENFRTCWDPTDIE